jgi:hypothetical protein
MFAYMATSKLPIQRNVQQPLVRQVRQMESHESLPTLNAPQNEVLGYASRFDSTGASGIR